MVRTEYIIRVRAGWSRAHGVRTVAIRNGNGGYGTKQGSSYRADFGSCASPIHSQRERVDGCAILTDKDHGRRVSCGRPRNITRAGCSAGHLLFTAGTCAAHCVGAEGGIHYSNKWRYNIASTPFDRVSSGNHKWDKEKRVVYRGPAIRVLTLLGLKTTASSRAASTMPRDRWRDKRCSKEANASHSWQTPTTDPVTEHRNTSISTHAKMSWDSTRSSPLTSSKAQN